MIRSVRIAALMALAGATLRAQGPPSDPKALAVVDRALTRMGGEATLRSVKSARLDILTQWQRTSFANHPYADAPTVERNVSLFDYDSRSWRNTRAYPPAAASLVDIVRDTVGGRTFLGPNGPTSVVPLNLAYIDERREQFAFAPERTLLMAKDAGGLKLLADTTIDGVPHARVRGTVDGFPSTWFIRRTDGLPSMVRFTADETNDFGLAPWGVQEVETWWSGWGRVAPGVMVPRQRDVRRIGRPYKRMTVLALTLNAPAPADSFVVADSTVAKYIATERRAMWDAPMDSAKIVENDFASFSPWFGSTGAVRIGGRWVLLETGQAAGAAKLVHAWLTKNTTGGIAAAIITNTGTGNGGVRWIAEQKLPVYAAVGAHGVVKQVMGSSPAAARLSEISSGRWAKVGTDSLWLERIDAPDAHGSMIVYSPTLRWLYSATLVGRASTQVELDAAIARLRAKGLPVEWQGGARGIHVAVPPAK